jgi:hypothetical protein
LKKVLIISYFFPPANFVGAERTESWYKFLPEHRIFPIIITRQWNENQRDLVDYVIDNKLAITKTEQGEIHRLPFYNSLRDKIANQYPKLFLVQKLLTLLELVLSNFFIKALPYANFYSYSKKYLKENPDIKYVICSGRPFQTFFIGYLLKKDFPYLKWIPDYRDEWGSHQNQPTRNFIQRILHQLELRSELKWTSNSSFFLSVSDYWVKSISQLNKRPGYTIKNGYTPVPNKTMISNKNHEQLTISYLGTLYSTQRIEIFIRAVIELVQSAVFPIQVNFIGIEIDPTQKAKVLQLIKGYESVFQVKDRMNKTELESYYSSADLLILTGFDNVKGWYPVKLFDYYQKEIPILLCPSDKDVIEQFIVETNTGFIANNEQACKEVLLSCIKQKQQQEEIKKNINYSAGETYSRAHQAKLLADIIHQNS